RARFVAADPPVDPDTVADRAAEQLMHRHIEGFAEDVPQRLVQTGQRTREYGTAPVERRLAHQLPQILDPAWVLADQQIGQFVDGGPHGVGPALHHGFTPPDQTRVGLDPAEQPPGRHLVRRDGRDLHCAEVAFSSVVARTSATSSAAFVSSVVTAWAAASGSAARTAASTRSWLGTGS